jgi:aspartate aminotransferase
MKLKPSRRVASLRRTLIREIFESAPPDALNLGLGQPDLPAPAWLRESLAHAALEGSSGYGPTAGFAELRERIAADYPDLSVGPDRVLVTTGCQEATFVVLGCLLDPGDEVLVPEPSFPGAARAAHAWGATPRSYPLRPERSFHLDPDEVLDAVGPATRLVVVISPSNPTGTVEPQESLDALVAGCAARGVGLLLDDTYRGLHWLSEEPAPGLRGDDLDHVVVCGGLSKSLALTGWRLGWAVAPDPELARKLVALQQTVLTCAPTPTQLAGLEAFSAGGRRAAWEVRARFDARRRIVEQKLPRDRFDRAPLEGAFYAWIDAGARGGGAAFARALLDEERIVVIPGEAFGAAAADWIRVSYAQEDRRLAAALDVLAARLERG